MSNLVRSSLSRSTPGSKSATVGAEDRAVCRRESGEGERVKEEGGEGGEWINGGEERWREGMRMGREERRREEEGVKGREEIGRGGRRRMGREGDGEVER